MANVKISNLPVAISVNGTDTFPMVQGGTTKQASLNTMLTFTQAGTNVVPRTYQSKMRDVVSAKDFGAVGDGVTDDSGAIQNAVDSLITAGGGTLYFPSGDYRFNSAVTAAITQQNENYVFCGDGPDASRLLIYNSTGGILLTANNNKTAVHIADLWFACEQAGAGIGFKYEQTTQVGPQARRMFTASNCSFRPTDRLSANYFDTALRVVGFYRPLLDSVVCWQGDATTAWPAALCVLNDCYSPNVQNSYFNGNAEIGISSVGGTEEGGWIQSTVVNGARTGINITRSGREPNFSITNSHVNARETAVYINGVKFFQATGNLIYCSKYDESASASAQPVTFRDFWLADCDMSVFTSNDFRTSNNDKRYHYYVEPGGNNESGVPKTSPVVRNVRTYESGYYATVGAGYGPIKVVNGVTVPDNLVFDLPEFIPSTDFVSYPTPYFYIDTAATDVRINVGNSYISFEESSANVALYHYQYSATPANNDAIAGVQARGNNSALAETTYMSSRVVCNDVTAGSEDGTYQLFTQVNGTLTRTFSAGSGVQIGTPSGAAPGVGAISLAGAGTLALIFDNGPGIYFGAGSPEGVVTAKVGSTYHRSDGGAGTSFYVKQSGTGNTGWAAK